MQIAVIYLAYLPFGTAYLERFLASYQTNQAGIDHELFILCNGHKNEMEAEPFKQVLVNSRIKAIWLFTNAKYDISAYLQVAKELNHPYLVFLNTYSQILHTNWLQFYYQNIQAENIGAVGATASWGNQVRDEKYRQIIVNPTSFLNLKALKELIKYRFNFYPNVSAHLRTTGFMVKRDIFLKMNYQLYKPYLMNLLHAFKESKLTTECFEHGNHCLTNQMISLGYEVLLVNKNGEGFPLKEWDKAHCFWQGEQENLLIADNQTEKYTLANAQEREYYRYFAWGRIH